jgi:hypothetical protein
MKWQIVKTGLNEFDFRCNGLTYFTGTKGQCQDYRDSFLISYGKAASKGSET